MRATTLSNDTYAPHEGRTATAQPFVVRAVLLVCCRQAFRQNIASKPCSCEGCRIKSFYRCWAITLPDFGGVGTGEVGWPRLDTSGFFTPAAACRILGLQEQKQGSVFRVLWFRGERWLEQVVRG